MEPIFMARKLDDFEDFFAELQWEDSVSIPQDFCTPDELLDSDTFRANLHLTTDLIKLKTPK
jgi:hypothetical protein